MATQISHEGMDALKDESREFMSKEVILFLLTKMAWSGADDFFQDVVR